MHEGLVRLRFLALKMYLRLLAGSDGAVVRTVANVNAVDFLQTVPPGTYGVVAGFNQIFRRNAIDCFRSLVNFHPSVLPLYRGPVPSYWVIRNGERQTGYTLHGVTERIDSGEVLFQETVACDGVQSASELNRAIAFAAQGTLDRYLTFILDGGPWECVKLEAHSIYRVPVDYGWRPEGPAVKLPTRRRRGQKQTPVS